MYGCSDQRACIDVARPRSVRLGDKGAVEGSNGLCPVTGSSRDMRRGTARLVTYGLAREYWMKKYLFHLRILDAGCGLHRAPVSKSMIVRRALLGAAARTAYSVMWH